MTKTLTTETLRALRDSLKSWQDGYDPVDDKEQYEMFVTAETAVGELLANREAQPVAEYGDAYQGAREDLSIWKRRALEAEDKVRHLERVNDHLVKEVQGEHRFGEPIITAPPAPAVNLTPDFETWFNSPESGFRVVNFHIQHELQLKAWSACRAAMLAQPVSQGCKLVPVEPTSQVIAPFIKHCCENEAWVRQAWREMLAAAPEGGN